ncbi:hypothetical protein PT974_07720 [Cladobotryum mycophilum]|uniref:BZIP domain-containing protein n=1 Tax=Cladobotryum mycophilum TaxID=491253 RepID=A0ABR0SHQ0_9HYPO
MSSDNQSLTPESQEEDWSGLGDPLLRRRVQNRINQRASRQRRLQQEREAGIVRRGRGRPRVLAIAIHRGTSGSSEVSNSRTQLLGQLGTLASTTQPTRRRTAAGGESFYLCEVDTATCVRLVERLTATVRQSVEQGDPASDLLLSLTQLNVFRGMMANMLALGLTLDTVKDDDAISSFNIPQPNISHHRLPPSLLPTDLQTSMVHHPWLDPFPIPSIRDILLSRQGEYDEVALCNDFVGLCSSGGDGQVGIIIWGDPWDPYGYEMTEFFAEKWMWLLRDCEEIQVSTNHWRSQRGEPPLFDVHRR